MWARAQTHERQSFIAAGAFGVIAKPFRLAAVVEDQAHAWSTISYAGAVAA